MAECTINGAHVVSATINMPLHGVWTALVECTSATAITGRVVIDVAGAVQFNGTVRRGGVYQNTCTLWIAGGYDGLKNAVYPVMYRDVPASVVLADALVVAGGQPLSTTASSALLATRLAKWTRTRGQVADVVEALANDLSASWRILRDGTLWFGTEAWTASTVRGQVQSQDTAAGCLRVSTETPLLIPGTTWSGYRLSYVVHKIQPSSSITEVWYE